MAERTDPPSFRVLACPAGRRGAATLRLVIAGALDTADDALADHVEALLGGCVDVVVDVQRIDGVDVNTIAALARLQLRLRARGGSLRLQRASADLRAVLCLLGLDGVLCVEEG